MQMRTPQNPASDYIGLLNRLTDALPKSLGYSTTWLIITYVMIDD